MAFIAGTERDFGVDLAGFGKVSALGETGTDGFSGENGNFTGFRENGPSGQRIRAGSAMPRI